MQTQDDTHRDTDRLPGRTDLWYLAVVWPAGLLLGAHFVRWGNYGPALVCALLPGLLLHAHRWTAVVTALFLCGGSSVWIGTGVAVVRARVATHRPYGRAALILGAVALATLLSTLVLRSAAARRRHRAGGSTVWASAVAFVTTAGLGAAAHLGVDDPPLLLFERLWRGGGWVEVFLLSTYAAVLAELLLRSDTPGVVRRRVWRFFSVVFFAQAIVGIAGVQRLLMSGSLHLPVPALILGGPLYRGGEGLFMPILFGVAALLGGPLWCSWLCYVGCWDHAASSARRTPGKPVRYREPVRIGIAAAVVGGAIGLRWAGVSAATAVVLGALFGLGGAAVMVGWSRRRGTMVHCTMYCPMGLVASLLGRLNPLRIRIDKGCSSCGACLDVCRYGALTPRQLRRGTVGFTCTLCGDCTTSCPSQRIAYSFPGLSPAAARQLFVVVAISLHALFLGFARL